MVGTAYFDGSGGKESPVIVVAGFFAPIGAWLKFERDWEKTLAWHGISELHMKHFAHSLGEYVAWKDDEPRRRRLLGDLLRVIKEHVDNSVAVAVLMEDYREIDKQYCLHEWAHPYALAGAHCMEKIRVWSKQFGYDFQQFDFIFERGDEGQTDLARLASKVFSVDPIFKPKEHNVAFQAADLIAYEHYKAHVKLLPEPDGTMGIEDFRIPFQSLVSVPGSAEWSYVDRGNILGDCAKHAVPLR